MEGQASKALHSRDVWQFSNVQAPQPGHNDVADEQFSVAGLHMPLVCFLLPAAFLNSLSELYMRQNSKLDRSVLKIFENLGLARICASPCWVLEEAETVEMAGNVTGAPGVGVVPPSASKGG